MAALMLPLVASAQTAPDLSPEQAGRPRAQKIDEAAALAKDFRFLKEGVLVVGTTTGRLPFAAYATDTKTPVGNAPDIAQLVADSLGRKLELVSTTWADWPLGCSRASSTWWCRT
jgi:polar amino acid transport system substrate-binding protein